MSTLHAEKATMVATASARTWKTSFSPIAPAGSPALNAFADTGVVPADADSTVLGTSGAFAAAGSLVPDVVAGVEVNSIGPDVVPAGADPSSGDFRSLRWC